VKGGKDELIGTREIKPSKKGNLTRMIFKTDHHRRISFRKLSGAEGSPYESGEKPEGRLILLTRKQLT
jgi:hypothetical protein